jgi:hypothetical protein
MKIGLTSSLILILFLIGCNSIITPTLPPIQSEATFTAVSSKTPLPKSTPTTVPVMTEISCEPSSNPFKDNPMMNSSEYGGGYYPNIKISKVCSFNGKISRGQIYKHQIIT